MRKLLRLPMQLGFEANDADNSNSGKSAGRSGKRLPNSASTPATIPSLVGPIGGGGTVLDQPQDQESHQTFWRADGETLLGTSGSGLAGGFESQTARRTRMCPRIVSKTQIDVKITQSQGLASPVHAELKTDIIPNIILELRKTPIVQRRMGQPKPTMLFVVLGIGALPSVMDSRRKRWSSIPGVQPRHDPPRECRLDTLPDLLRVKHENKMKQGRRRCLPCSFFVGQFELRLGSRWEFDPFLKNTSNGTISANSRNPKE